ncbi:nitroreductase [Haloterrigena turkmenica DSM 5511]|uniref:Nitroreductase n=1 Tax=Haloterrigena turkmenica (strain ATCC 51198 / DSM 5511 / JCM 9101 / NCIMB 13204 / VKM B-1734 / 4k) TaxID=543526 RepID=D2RV74_HALTV|nr:nitroreductase family protein [Haloterrigena turkmenica]ADB61275.1 nitroreductase [Haloterrigena turkmenica DSM 5511]
MQDTLESRHELRDDVAEHRDPEYDIDPLFVNRWSPRAMTGDPLDEEEYLPLFEAARWAPSAFNNQHWRFLVADREDEEWDAFLDLLSENNRTWASDAAVLAVIVSKTTFDHNGEPAPVHSFDTGAAWENLALEGARRGLAVHGMAGFDYERAAEELNVPEEYAVEAMVAIGEHAPPETLSEELQDREQPSDRKPLSEIVHRGGFQ